MDTTTQQQRETTHQKGHARVRTRTGALLFAIVPIAALFMTLLSAPTAQAQEPEAGFVPVQPARLLETRPGQSTTDGLNQGQGQLAAGTTTEIPITGRGNIDTNATSALLNITATDANAFGYLTIYPCGQTQPNTANLVYEANQTISNAAIAEISTTGTICIYTSTTTHLIIDTSGYHTSGSGPGEPGITPLASKVVPTGPGRGIVQGDASLALPGGGQINLLASNLEVELDDFGQFEKIDAGVATFALPTVGGLEGAFMDRLISGVVGMAEGRDLAHLKAHLIDDHTYLYFDTGNQPFELFLDFDESQSGASSLPQRISLPTGGGSSLFVIDLDGDYFYVSVPCDALIPQGPAKKQRPANRVDSVPIADPAGIPGASIDLSSFSPGGCGLGWSAGGSIPFVPWQQGTISVPSDFQANVVIDGTIPVHPSVSVDGEVFIDFGQDQMTVWTNAEIDLKPNFAGGAVEVSIPAARGTAGLSIGANNFDLWVSATAGSSVQNEESQLLADLLPISGVIDLNAELHFLNGEFDEDTSFFELSGDVAISSDNPVTELVDLDIGTMTTAEGSIRIDKTGVEVQGRIDSSPIAGIDLAGSAELAMLIPFADLSDSYFEVRGNLNAGGTAIAGNAFFRVDKTGVFVRGSLDIGTTANVLLAGEITTNGFQLTGSAQVVLPVGDLDKLAADTYNGLGWDERLTLFSRVENNIDRRIGEINAANPTQGRILRDGVNALRDARSFVSDTRNKLANDRAVVTRINNEIRSEINWFTNLPWYEKPFAAPGHVLRLGGLEAEKLAAQGVVEITLLTLDGANVVLAASEQGFIAVVGQDAELNALAHMQVELYWGRFTSNIIRTLLNGADAFLDMFGIDGSAVGQVDFTVGTFGVGASASLTWCNQTCTQLVGAQVEITPVPKVCATIAGLPACVEI